VQACCKIVKINLTLHIIMTQNQYFKTAQQFSGYLSILRYNLAMYFGYAIIEDIFIEMMLLSCKLVHWCLYNQGSKLGSLCVKVVSFQYFPLAVVDIWLGVSEFTIFPNETMIVKN